MTASSRCTICRHGRRSEIEQAAVSAPPTLEGRLGIAQEFAVSRASLERHLAKCTPPARVRRVRRAKPPEDVAPDSGAREMPVEPEGTIVEAPETHEVSLPPARDLESPDRELQRRKQLFTRHLERPDLGLQELKKVADALAAIDRLEIARLRDERPIHEHADFNGLVVDLVEAVVAELGPHAPEGLEARIAERLEELQAARAAVVPLRRAS